MAYGDPVFKFVRGGSIVTAASNAHQLFGAYSGLSLLNNSEVVHIIVSASGGDFRMSVDPDTPATNDSALRIQSAASLFDLPPLSVGDASRITVAREGSNNPIMFWTVFRRVP